jgi:hypothetical protein
MVGLTCFFILVFSLLESSFSEVQNLPFEAGQHFYSGGQKNVKTFSHEFFGRSPRRGSKHPANLSSTRPNQQSPSNASAFQLSGCPRFLIQHSDGAVVSSFCILVRVAYRGKSSSTQFP